MQHSHNESHNSSHVHFPYVNFIRVFVQIEDPEVPVLQWWWSFSPAGFKNLYVSFDFLNSPNIIQRIRKFLEKIKALQKETGKGHYINCSSSF